MSKFLTPPVWYDQHGHLNDMLTGDAVTSSDIAIGSKARAADGGVAINGGATDGGVAINGAADGGVAINGAATGGGVAIGSKKTLARATGGGIAIGAGASATGNQIQLGKNDTAYTLNVGNGNGILKCRASEIAPVSYKINKYFSTATSTISYPGNFILKQNGVYEFVFSINGGLQTVPIVFSGTKSDTVKTYFNLSYDDTSSGGMIIYGSVMWAENGINLKFSTVATPGGDHIKIYLNHIVYLGSF